MLIVALDTPDIRSARHIVDAVSDSTDFFKIGLQLLYCGGLELATSLIMDGKRVFIDAKLNDIGSTTRRAVEVIADIGAEMVTVHADYETVEAAVAGAGSMKVLVVTCLTSIGGPGIDCIVSSRARMAELTGAAGVVCSGLETALVRQNASAGFLIVNPGVRSSGVSRDDQSRVVTPREAKDAGASYIVVGREIVNAPDPGAAAADIVKALQ